MLSSATSPSSSRRFESSTDPYSSAIVDDLISGASDWRNVQDVVRLTFKALSDVVKAQGSAIRDLERQMPQKLSKAEAQTLLSQKVSSSELTGHLADLQALIESRGPLMDLQTQLEQKVSRSDLTFMLGSRPTAEEVKTLVDAKVARRDLDAAADMILAKLEENTRDLSRRIANCALERDFRAIESVLQEKANVTDIEEMMNEKASKQMLSAALARKVNISDLEMMLSTKAERADLQALMGMVEAKAEARWVQQLATQLDSKAESSDFTSFSDELTLKASRRDLDSLHSSLISEIRDISKQLTGQISSLDEQTTNLTSEIDRVRTSLLTAINKKVENRDMDKWMSLLSKKLDEDKVTDLLRLHRTEISELISTVKTENSTEKSVAEQKISEKIVKIEQELREMAVESGQFRDEVLEIHRKEQDDHSKYIKSLHSSMKFELNGDLSSLRDQIDALTKNISAIYKEKTNNSDLNEVKAQLLTAISARPSSENLQSGLIEMKMEVNSAVQSFKDELKSKMVKIEGEIGEILDKKVNFSDFEGYLGEKADSAMVTRLCNMKVSG